MGLNESPFRDDTGEAIDLIDAALFSGDEFWDKQRRAELRSVIARWNRQLDEAEEMADAQEENGSGDYGIDRA